MTNPLIVSAAIAGVILLIVAAYFLLRGKKKTPARQCTLDTAWNRYVEKFPGVPRTIT